MADARWQARLHRRAQPSRRAHPRRSLLLHRIVACGDGGRAHRGGGSSFIRIVHKLEDIFWHAPAPLGSKTTRQSSVNFPPDSLLYDVVLLGFCFLIEHALVPIHFLCLDMTCAHPFLRLIVLSVA
jgi:hypothetical protein